MERYPVIKYEVWAHPAIGPIVAATADRIGAFQARDHLASAMSDLVPTVRDYRPQLDRDLRIEIIKPDGTSLHTEDQLPTVAEILK